MAKIPKQTRAVLSQADAEALANWMYKSKLKAKEMTKEDILFLQGGLVAMLDASFAVGFIEALVRSSANLPGGPAKVIKAFLKGAGKNLVKYKDKDDLQEMMKKPVIYKMAKDEVVRATRTTWAVREQTGSL